MIATSPAGITTHDWTEDSAAAVPVDMTPSSGSSTIGIIEVMGRGRASVSQ